MEITEINVEFVKPKDGLMAFASIVLNDALYLGSIAIHQKLDGTGHRLTFPTRKLGNSQIQVFHPIRRPLGQAIEQAIFQKLKNVMSKQNAGHDSIDLGSHAV